MVMMALPITTNGLRARSDRLGGGGTCSGSSAARGLRGEIGGRSLIDVTWVLSLRSMPGHVDSGFSSRHRHSREDHAHTRIQSAIVLHLDPIALCLARLSASGRHLSPGLTM